MFLVILLWISDDDRLRELLASHVQLKGPLSLGRRPAMPKETENAILRHSEGRAFQQLQGGRKRACGTIERCLYISTCLANTRFRTLETIR